MIFLNLEKEKVSVSYDISESRKFQYHIFLNLEKEKVSVLYDISEPRKRESFQYRMILLNLESFSII